MKPTLSLRAPASINWNSRRQLLFRHPHEFLRPWNKTPLRLFRLKPTPLRMNPLADQLTSLLPRLWRFALRLTRQHEDAQDLVQRSCVRALERQHQWNPATPALPWLYAILHSIWLNEVDARRLRLVGRVDSEDAPDVADTATADPETALLYRQVIAAVEALPPAQRVVMLLVGVEGFSYREASDVLGVPIGTVMSRLSRARVAIGERFESRPQIDSDIDNDQHGEGINHVA